MSALATAWRITVYDAEPGGGPLAIEGDGCRFIYARAGTIRIHGGDAIAEDDGRLLSGSFAATLDGLAWVYEVASADMPFPDGLSVVFSQVVRPAFGRPFLVRADRIESRPRAQTPRHGHRGPGIRRLVQGRLLAQIGEAVERVEAGQAWFETGADPVVGTNIGDTNAIFVRVMVLPRALQGGASSFTAWDDAEAAKPRSVDARMFGEMLVD